MLYGSLFEAQYYAVLLVEEGTMKDAWENKKKIKTRITVLIYLFFLISLFIYLVIHFFIYCIHLLVSNPFICVCLSIRLFREADLNKSRKKIAKVTTRPPNERIKWRRHARVGRWVGRERGW